MIYICYDDGYKEVNTLTFPGLMDILNKKNLLFDTEDKKGDLINVVKTSTQLKGKPLILTELKLKLIEYATAIHEIEAGDNPILYYDVLNCFIRLRKDYIIIKN